MSQFVGSWVPHYNQNGDWVCRFYVDDTKCNPPSRPDFIGSDGTPLRFFNKKSAQIKCDALNKQKEVPR